MTTPILLVALLTACELGQIAVARTEPQIVVHAVLNASADTQIVLVEWSLTGATPIKNTPFNPGEPILSDGGVPAGNALVEIINPDGQAVRGVESGAGVYRVPIAGASLRLGGTYTLRVRAATGEATATTTVPGARPAARLPQLTFNRSRDTLDLRWAPIPGARSYALRIDGPFGPFFLFTDSVHFRFNGELRNLFAENFPRVFIPGFREQLLVAAVDSNFYDYYRTQNDPFTGSGIISRVTGGIGFFGSLVSVVERTINVTADRKDSVEGRFVLTANPGGSGPPVATEVSLYVESPPATDGAPAALSGSYLSTGPQTRGVTGRQLGKAVALSFLAGQFAADTMSVFTGEQRADTLIGAFRGRVGTAIFIKVR